MDDTTNPPEGTSSLLNLTGASSSGVSPLEQEVLDEYERLVRNMNQVSFLICLLGGLGKRGGGAGKEQSRVEG